MLKQPLPGRARRGAGLAVLVVALAAGSYGAWALQPAAADQAPAYLGNVLWGNLADVDVRIKQKNAEPIGVFGGSMGQKPDGTTLVHMNGVSPLEVEIGDGKDQLVFEAQATNTVSEKPLVVWTLRRHGRRIEQGRIKLSDDPQVFVVGGAKHETASSATLTFLAARGTTISGAGAAGAEPLAMDSSGRYVLEDSVMVGDEYKVAGSADLLLHISPSGTVSDVEIERALPPKAFTKEQATEYASSMRFRPFIQGGKQTATLARTTIHFAPSTEAVQHPPAWFNRAPTDKNRGARPSSGDKGTASDESASVDIQSKNATPPKYPADAVAKRITGKVVLIVDVAADGSVANAHVEKSEPAGVFDQVTLEAAKAWKFKPAIVDGKPAPGRVRVPVTFEMDRDDAVAPKPAGGNA